MRTISNLFVLAALLAACGSEAADGRDRRAPAPAATPAAAASPAAPASPAATVPGGEISKADLARQICFFTPAEISEHLGFSVAAGVAETTMLESYNSASCTYQGQANTLRVHAYWLRADEIAGTRAGMTRMSGGGRTEILAGDPDSAYLHDMQDNGTSIHYLRRNLRIQVHATSGMTPFATMKPKLLSLRRVP